MNAPTSTGENQAKICRVKAPDEVLASISSPMAVAGITRIADLTRLDIIGIPTWQAIMPAAFTLSVSQGKGGSHIEAKLSAAMEAIEHISWERFHPVPRWDSHETLRDEQAVLVTELSDFIHGPVAPGAVLPWCSAQDLATGNKVLIPCDLVLVQRDGSYRKWLRRAFSTTNGLAAGSTLAEATLHALFEVIERDAQACAEYLMENENIPRSQVDVDSFSAPSVQELVAKVRRAGLNVRVFSNDNEMGLPCYSAYLLNETVMGLNNIGHGAHFYPDIAVARAITEAAQGRITMISGVREDNYRADYRCLYEVGGVMAKRAHYEMALSPQPVSAPILPLACFSSPDEAVDYLVALLRQMGRRYVLRIDMTENAIRVPVAKVLVPGLSGYHQPLARRVAEYRAWRLRNEVA